MHAMWIKAMADIQSVPSRTLVVSGDSAIRVLLDLEKIGAHLEMRGDTLTLFASDSESVPSDLVARARAVKPFLKGIIRRRYQNWNIEI